MKNISRIKFLVSNLRGLNTIFYDIGCDHGKIGFEILKENATSKVVFCDISKINLDKAKMLLNRNNDFLIRCDFINCYGVPSDALATGIGLVFGLGGETIIDILNDNKSNLKEFYLQPATSVVKLRKYLNNNGFEILSDYNFMANNNFYDLIHVVKNDNCTELTEEELFLGKDNICRCDAEYINYLTKEFDNLVKVLAKFNNNVVQYNLQNDKIKDYVIKYNLIKRKLEGEKSV